MAASLSVAVSTAANSREGDFLFRVVSRERSVGAMVALGLCDHLDNRGEGAARTTMP